MAVATYRRPAELRRCLTGVSEQITSLGRTTDDHVGVLVVDNDPAGGAAVVVAEFTHVAYVHEPEPGIAAARNRALDEAAGSQVLVFIDDDERPAEGWLPALLHTYRASGATAVAGRVESEFDGELDPWIDAGAFYRRVRRRTGAVMDMAATNNLLLDLDAVRALGVRFDPRFGLTGGEDHLFTRTLHARGATVVWCDEAVVIDQVSVARMTRGAVLRRAMSMASRAPRTDLVLADGPVSRLGVRASSAARGLGRIGVGWAWAGAGAVSGSLERRARGARTVARGVGLTAGALGYVHHEYARTNNRVRPTVQVYDTLRSAHLERAHVEPALILYRRTRYDFDETLMRGLEAHRVTAVGLMWTILRCCPVTVEVNEPLMRSGLLRALLAATAARVSGMARHTSVHVVTYAIENHDPFSVPVAGRARTRVRRSGELLLASLLTSQLDRVAFGTSSAAEVYRSRFGARLGRVHQRTVPALPAECGCGPLADAPASRVLFLGALDERKGVPQLLDAWPLVRPAQGEATLTIVGVGALAETTENWASGRPEVRVLLDPPRERVHRALREADILVLASQPSPGWREQVGLPLVEGLAHGCAVVTTEQSGLAGWLAAHGHAVVPVALGPQGLADGIVRTLRVARPAPSVLADLPDVDGRLAAGTWLWSEEDER